jgi:hypothetical protein
MRLRTSALLVAAAAAVVAQAWLAGHSLRSSAIIAMFCCNRSRLSCMAPLACASLDSPGTSPAPGSTAMLLDRIRGALWGEQAYVALQPVNRTTSWSLLWTHHQQPQSMQLSLMISFLLAAGVAAVAAHERPPAHPERCRPRCCYCCCCCCRYIHCRCAVYASTLVLFSNRLEARLWDNHRLSGAQGYCTVEGLRPVL